MKKYIALMLVILTVLCCFTACKNSEDSSNIPPEDIKVIDFDTTREPDETTTVKNNKNITINVPSVLAESHADGSLEQYAATYGYKIEKEEDGSVTMKMDGITYSLMLSNIGMEVMMSLGDIVDGNDFPYAVRLQDYNQDFSYILMLVDTKEYKKHKDEKPYEDLAFYTGQCGLYYQFFTQNQEKKCEVILASSETGKIVYRETYTGNY